MFYNKRCKKFRKNQFFSNIFTFLSITRQNFENNLRILANIEKFSHKDLKIYGFRQYVLKNYRLYFFFFFVFFNKDYTFYTTQKSIYYSIFFVFFNKDYTFLPNLSQKLRSNHFLQ